MDGLVDGGVDGLDVGIDGMSGWMNERLVCCLEDGYLLLIWVDKWMIAK